MDGFGQHRGAVKKGSLDAGAPHTLVAIKGVWVARVEPERGVTDGEHANGEELHPEIKHKKPRDRWNPIPETIFSRKIRFPILDSGVDADTTKGLPMVGRGQC